MADITSQQIIQNLSNFGYTITPQQVAQAQVVAGGFADIVDRTITTPTGGQQTYATPSGAVVTAGGQMVSPPPQIQQQQVLPNVPDPQLDANFEAALQTAKANGVTDDQIAQARAMYGGVTTNNIQNLTRMIETMNATTQFSNPYFKAQVAVATDALSRSLSATTGDLSYQEGTLNRTLEQLRQSTSASKEFLGFQEQHELRNLEKSYEQELESTRQSLASVGKTSSSVRSRTETLLGEQKEGLVESTRRKYAYQTGGLERTLLGTEQQTAAQLGYLADKATQDRIAALRQTESQVGTATLQNLGYSGLLGSQTGSLPYLQQSQALAAGQTAITSPSFAF